MFEKSFQSRNEPDFMNQQCCYQVRLSLKEDLDACYSYINQTQEILVDVYKSNLDSATKKKIADLIFSF